MSEEAGSSSSVTCLPLPVTSSEPRKSTPLKKQHIVRSLATHDTTGRKVLSLGKGRTARKVKAMAKSHHENPFKKPSVASTSVKVASTSVAADSRLVRSFYTF